MKNKLNYSLRFFVAVSACAFLLLSYQSCKKDDKLPDNPYDSINRDTVTYDIPIDSLNITYVHKKVLQAKCALPGCHDGNFEPDFRSVQSSFSNLVCSGFEKQCPERVYLSGYPLRHRALGFV
ncbi:MAG: hypothetical protein IPH78_12635 [Bacteroidetes bacterium]|nr:hypothetical protein [Bacteroidota bacterium]